MTTMRKAFEEILKNYGQTIFLQRRLDAGGFADTLEMWTVRRTNRSGLNQAQQERAPGIIHNVDVYWYFPADAAPREGDRVYEDDPRYAQGVAAWVLDVAQPMYGTNSELVFYASGCTREFPN